MTIDLTEFERRSPALADFESAARAILRFLHDRLGFALWLVTRRSGDEWLVLEREDHAYGIDPGAVYRWQDTLCARMVHGQGPNIVPNVDAVPEYAAAELRARLPVSAYVGFPIYAPDGSVFGTLAALDPAPQPAEIGEEHALLELLTGLLSTILQEELLQVQVARRAEIAERESLVDPLTGLGNRRAWKHALEAEEARVRRYGHAACVLVADVDGLKAVNDSQGHQAGDELLRRVAWVLLSSRRVQDAVSRIGGDEFALLAVEADMEAGREILRRLKAAFEREGLSVSVGLAPRRATSDLVATWKAADAAMYLSKRATGRGRGEARSTLDEHA